MDSTRAETPCLIIVPTLSYTDGIITATRAQQHAGVPALTLVIEDQDRQGFTKTVNRGLSQAKGDVVILVDDCVTPDNWLRDLQTAVYERARLNIWFAGPSGPCRTIPQNTGRPGDKRRPRTVGHLAGFCLYAKREAVELRLDERFIHYASDVDWQRRAKQHGAHSLWLPSVYVDHGLHKPHQEWWEHDQRLLAEVWS